mmetsp:Transcript_11186/g.50712  ORF Transcript_11186/g.50712 Transcript_11186/m.50712 type:complete len:530 (+) Transcript_11186:2929-4518(+)
MKNPPARYEGTSARRRCAQIPSQSSSESRSTIFGAERLDAGAPAVPPPAPAAAFASPLTSTTLPPNTLAPTFGILAPPPPPPPPPSPRSRPRRNAPSSWTLRRRLGASSRRARTPTRCSTSTPPPSPTSRWRISTRCSSCAWRSAATRTPGRRRSTSCEPLTTRFAARGSADCTECSGTAAPLPSPRTSPRRARLSRPRRAPPRTRRLPRRNRTKAPERNPRMTRGTRGTPRVPPRTPRRAPPRTSRRVATNTRASPRRPRSARRSSPRLSPRLRHASDARRNAARMKSSHTTISGPRTVLWRGSFRRPCRPRLRPRRLQRRLPPPPRPRRRPPPPPRLRRRLQPPRLRQRPRRTPPPPPPRRLKRRRCSPLRPPPNPSMTATTKTRSPPPPLAHPPWSSRSRRNGARRTSCSTRPFPASGTFSPPGTEPRTPPSSTTRGLDISASPPAAPTTRTPRWATRSSAAWTSCSSRPSAPRAGSRAWRRWCRRGSTPSARGTGRLRNRSCWRCSTTCSTARPSSRRPAGPKSA